MAKGTYIVRARDANATNGLIMGYGNSTTRYKGGAVANSRFLDFNFENAATSGDNRGMYLRLFHTGTGGGGEALRVFTTVNANCGTAHGAHISLNFLNTAGASETSGLGVAGRNTLHIPNVASWAPTGTYAAVQAEIYSDGSLSDPAGMTKLSFLRIVNGGNATGRADVDDDAFLMELSGFTNASGNMVSGNTAAQSTLDFTNWVTLKIDIGGTTHYIPAAQTIGAST